MFAISRFCIDSNKLSSALSIRASCCCGSARDSHRCIDGVAAGSYCLQAYIGGERFPELASLSPEKLFALTCEDLRVLLGVKGKPTFQHCVFYPRAIPQYNLGYGRYREQMADIEKKAPGLFFAGHYRDGISLSDTIVSACNVADRAGEFLSSQPVHQREDRVPA